jgi:hypothetical protein
MKRWGRIVSLIGVGCSSLCFRALPLLVLWLPAFALGWLHNEKLTRGMLLMFLAMSLFGTVRAYQQHGDPKPGIVTLIGAALLVGAAWGDVRPIGGWLAMATLVAAWLWDMRLLKGINHAHTERCE